MTVKTSEVNPYVELMYTEFKDWSFDETASENKGLWRSKIFTCEADKALDLEIGTGNGTHFAQLTENFPERNFIGLELKFKTLVQSIRRSVRAGCSNGRMARYRAEGVKELFAKEELNNVYIHFPDPWPKKRHNKNRLIQTQFLLDLHFVMQDGGLVEFKTDDYSYFQWAMNYFRHSPFTIKFFTEDLHNSFRKTKTLSLTLNPFFWRRNNLFFIVC